MISVRRARIAAWPLYSTSSSGSVMLCGCCVINCCAYHIGFRVIAAQTYFRSIPCQEHLKRVGQILDKMPSICHLDGLWSTERCSKSRLSASIPAEHFDVRMRLEPGCGGCYSTIRQEINHAMALKIHKKGAIFETTSKCPIVDADLGGLLGNGRRDGFEPSEHRGRRGRQPQACR